MANLHFHLLAVFTGWRISMSFKSCQLQFPLGEAILVSILRPHHPASVCQSFIIFAHNSQFSFICARAPVCWCVCGRQTRSALLPSPRLDLLVALVTLLPIFVFLPFCCTFPFYADSLAFNSFSPKRVAVIFLCTMLTLVRFIVFIAVQN